MCTEYATMGLNILGVFGYSSLVLIGSLDFDKEEIGHAYNIVAMDNGVYLVDMASSAIVTDLDGNLLDEVPFYKELTEEELQNILDKKEPISLNNVFYIYFGENNFKFEEDRQRTYRVSNMVLKDSFKNKKKSVYFAPERVPCVLLCGVSMPCLIEKIEALCSFLQAENLGNFQSLQRMF